MNSRFWLVLFLAASLLPWRVAFACAHETQVVHQRCCCKDTVTRCPKIKTGTASCCSIVAVPAQQLADSDSQVLPSADGGKDGKLPALPPATSGPSTSWAFAPILSRHVRPTDVFGLQGSDLYLQTARLRL